MKELTLFPGQPMRIYDPPKIIDEIAEAHKWLVQIKKNGHRAIVRCDKSGQVTIFSRHGDPLTAAKRQDWQWLAEVFPPPFVFDGELVGPRQAGSKHDTLHIWDCALMRGYSWLMMPYHERLGYLAEHWYEHANELEGTAYFHASWPVVQWQELWDALTDPDGPDEGLVFKRHDVPLAWHRKPGVKDVHQLKLRKKG